MRHIFYVLAVVIGYVTIASAVVFQLFFRYQYVAVGNEVWSIDRLTRHATTIVAAPTRAPVPKTVVRATVAHATAVRARVTFPRKPNRTHSTSTSTSTSVSTSVK